MLFWKSLYSLGSDVEGLNYLGYVMIDHTSVTMYYYIYKYIYIYIYKKKRKKKAYQYLLWGFHGSYDPTKVEIYNCFIISSSV